MKTKQKVIPPMRFSVRQLRDYARNSKNSQSSLTGNLSLKSLNKLECENFDLNLSRSDSGHIDVFAQALEDVNLRRIFKRVQ